VDKTAGTDSFHITIEFPDHRGEARDCAVYLDQSSGKNKNPMYQANAAREATMSKCNAYPVALAMQFRRREFLRICLVKAPRADILWLF
jgi:hypothetical protein